MTFAVYEMDEQANLELYAGSTTCFDVNLPGPKTIGSSKASLATPQSFVYDHSLAQGYVTEDNHAPIKKSNVHKISFFVILNVKFDFNGEKAICIHI